MSRKGESPAFRVGKGQGFPTCEPRKGHFGSFGAKGQQCSRTKTKEENIINRLEDDAPKSQEIPGKTVLAQMDTATPIILGKEQRMGKNGVQVWF